MSDVSASFEETNRMREKLGLQPLARPNKESVSAARDAAARDAEQAAREAEDEQLRQELAKRKEQRLKNAVVEGKTLGETLAKQTAGSALDWVNRSRKVTDQERLKAEQRARLIAEQEQQMAEYTSSDVAHLKVLHDSDQFAEGSTTILTLKDSRILKGVDQENDEEDELENVHLVDSEIVARNAERKKKKPTYDVYNEDAVLLGKYDEEKTKKDGIRLGELTGTYDIDSTTQNARVRNNLAKIEGAGTKYDLHSELKVASDYKEVKFKGKKKKEKTVVRKRPIIDDDEETPTTTDESKFVLPEPSPEERAQDHAKRSAASEKPDWMTSTQEQVKKSQDLRDQSYLRALQKAELATAQLKSTYYNKSTQPPPIITEDDDDAIVLQEALARARRMAVKKEEKDATLKLAEQVRADQQAKDKVKQEEEDSIRVKLEPSDDSMADDTPAPEPTTISLSTTTEFCRGLDLDTDIRVKREKQDEKQEEPVKVETTKDDDEMDVDEKQQEKTTIKEEDETKEDDEEVLASVLDDEPTADQSVTGALELFRKRAMFESGFSEQVGRRKDKVLDIGVDASTLPLIRVDDEGRALKPKEAFRQLSHKFHGQKPGFKKREKEQKRHAEEQRKRAMMMDATHSTGVSGKLMEAQKSSGQAYLVLDKGIRQQLEKTAKAKKEGDAEHAKNAKRKASIMDETVDRPSNTSSSTSSSTSKGINHVVGDIRTKVSVQLKAEPSKKRRIAASEFAGADDEDETEQQ